MASAPELKATLQLPQTAFPMKANLPQNEPLRLKKWAEMRLWNELRKAGAGRPAYILHDGPPYANGPIHLGHALNKGLKDFVVKSKTMAGFDSPYIPGFDCHGLPIEIKVDEQLGRKKLEMPVPAVLEACRAYAQKYVDLQTSQFERIGIFGRWDNSYKTMSRQYEAKTLEALYGFLEQDFVYRGLKPVYWCIHDRTALADAEIEYEQHTSPSVYVRYKLTSDAAALDESLKGREVYTIIWTTTPWTLPASLAVAFHPDFEYVALESSQTPGAPGPSHLGTGDTTTANSPVYVVAAELAPQVIAACNLGETKELARFKGRALDRTTYQHPFLNRSILGVLATYVTADAGTGAVHTAPSHGADDFYTGQRYGLDLTCNVDDVGRIHATDWSGDAPPPYDGKKVFAANPIIIELLKERGALMAQANLQHSYPHCWRCHNPVIFRATEQWFISLETPMKRPRSSDKAGTDTTFRQLSIEEIDKVKWDPSWGKERITNMIATRPDWCISRQRIWGVPIAVLMCTSCQKPLIDAALNKKIVTLFENEGAEAWHTTSVEALTPTGAKCAQCGNTTFRKETDILDVWFDSGTSWLAVSESDPDLKAAYAQFEKNDSVKVLYLEGGDQHRGWFHSSLLTSVALRGRAPYSHVATAGWTLDEQGRAMSKSLGNGVDPVDIANRMGGEIVRLWVASIDFREDMAASENLMARCADIYRKLRNTFRFLLGNLAGFTPATDAVPEAELLPLDRYMLARTRDLTEKILGWYADFEFHRIYHAVNEFAIVDLSSFYLDVLKDRMYTFAPTSKERLSAQTVLWKIAEALVRLVAPILSFTADEVWEYLPPVEGREASVHLALFPKPEEVFSENPDVILGEWKRLFAIREEVFSALEVARQQGEIGKGLGARVDIRASEADTAFLNSFPRESLAEFFNVSELDIKVSAVQIRAARGVNEDGSPDDKPRAVAFAATGIKCNRCWRFTHDTSNYGIWADVCDRCQYHLGLMNVAPPQPEGAAV
ncbi:isoleucine--tRNA ligase [Terracidiphilus gabretensis]|uniref:isoleucine--tRNA ligase n=1 Tax=Terracidiphilus gabretensis TaxID=1577687 RepID=UPI00071C0A60|nr:isoleucine--tRNA ligase [Terracidiphilus gabretensis]